MDSKKQKRIEEEKIADAVEEKREEDMAAEVDAVMKKYDRESNTRIWEGTPKKVIIGIQAFFALLCIYVTLFATWLDQVRLTSFVGLVLLMGYLTYPAKKGKQKVNYIPWYDVLLMTAGIAAFLYYCFNAKTLIVRMPTLYAYEIVLGICGIISLMELCRRSVGVPILCVAGVFMLYAAYYYFFKKSLGINALKTMTYNLFYASTGILSTPINVCSKYIVVFIIFGAFLERTGISEFFISMANSLAGSASGGPAKVAVISSALCGMVSGSSVGNTVTTGSVTIPMMKKTGYKPEFAGAVEAAASTGGQIMPPIMGAAAFLMAEYVKVPYSNIVVRAILPATLYFLGIFICVHLEAKKLGLKGISRDQLPRFRSLVKRTYLLLPLVILVYLVSSNTKTMAYSAAYAIIFAIAVSNVEKVKVPSLLAIVVLLAELFLPWSAIDPAGELSIVHTILFAGSLVLCIISLYGKDAVLTMEKFIDALAAGGKSCISVAAACGVAGLIAGSITITGLASQLISAIVNLTNNVTAVTVFFALILGGVIYAVINTALKGKLGKTAVVIGIAAAAAAAGALIASNGLYHLCEATGIEWDSCRTFLALFLTMLCCIVLGMGVPTTANYCIMASTCAPILIKIGVPAMAAHFFVFYFGIVADITPPVALAAYAGSAIAKSNPMKTAFNATKLAIAAFVVPYVFALSPALLLIDTNAVEVALNVVTALCGIFGIAAGLEGFISRKLLGMERIICIFGGLMMLVPGSFTDIIGLIILGLVIAMQKNKLFKKAAA